MNFVHRGRRYRRQAFSTASEAINLKWDNVLFRSRTLIIVESKDRDYRTIPIHPDLIRRLKDLPTQKNVHLFDAGTNKPI